MDQLFRLGKRELICLLLFTCNSICGFCSERFPLPLGAWDGLRYFIMALPEPSIIFLKTYALRLTLLYVYPQHLDLITITASSSTRKFDFLQFKSLFSHVHLKNCFFILPSCIFF